MPTYGGTGTHRDGLAFLERITLGLEAKCKAVHKFGYNPDIDSGSGFEAIWNGGGRYTGFNASAAETVTVSSSSADDTDGGAGAQVVKLYGLDKDGYEIEESLFMSGLGTSTSVQEYLRLPRARITAAGATGKNVGDVTIRQSTTTENVFAVIAAGTGRTLIAAYTIPAEKVGYLVSWAASAAKGGGGESQVRLLVRHLGGIFETVELTAVIGTGSSRFHHEHAVWPKHPPMTDIEIVADASANNSGVSGDFTLVLIDEEQ